MKRSPRHPVVAWADATRGLWSIYLRRWNGATWMELDGSGAGGGISQPTKLGFAYLTASRSPSLALDPSGNPIVAWEDDSSWATGNWEIYLRRRGGGARAEGGASGSA